MLFLTNESGVSLGGRSIGMVRAFRNVWKSFTLKTFNIPEALAQNGSVSAKIPSLGFGDFSMANTDDMTFFGPASHGTHI